MRRTVRLLLIAGWCLLNSGTLHAQETDSFWRRFTNLVARGQSGPVQAEPRPLLTDVSRTSPTSSFESRGVVYLEEFRGPAAPPRLIAAPRPPLPKLSTVRPSLPPAPTPVRPAVAAADDATLLSRMSRLVSQACPQGRNVKLTLQSDREVTVEMEVSTTAQANAFAAQIFAIRELDPFRVNLKFSVPQS